MLNGTMRSRQTSRARWLSAAGSRPTLRSKSSFRAALAGSRLEQLLLAGSDGARRQLLTHHRDTFVDFKNRRSKPH
jgi:hypothetical protein